MNGEIQTLRAKIEADRFEIGRFPASLEGLGGILSPTPI
jgi:hypothetical protein